MVNVYVHGPKWFFGADAILVAFAALIAICVAFASFRLYRMTKERKYAFFTASFVLLTLSFLARAITDTILEEIFFSVPVHYAGLVFFYGYVAHILLALTAYLLLIVITHKINDKRIIALLFLILVPCLLISSSYYLSFYWLSAIFLTFISIAYYQNYRKVCTVSSCLVFIAFVLLSLAQVQFLLEAVNISFYVSAHITQAIGFLLLLMALIRTLLK
ncbi:MAG: hypothetical protein QW165_02405 [Candidatus Woesearchaeota archaeon]